jgi:hypothetical protein
MGPSTADTGEMRPTTPLGYINAQVLAYVHYGVVVEVIVRKILQRIGQKIGPKPRARFSLSASVYPVAKKETAITQCRVMTKDPPSGISDI